MHVRVHGVWCDPDHATLLAEGTNEKSIDQFDDLKRIELYRTPDRANYFVQIEEGYDMKIQLLSETEARDFYKELPDHRLDSTQAFAN